MTQPLRQWTRSRGPAWLAGLFLLGLVGGPAPAAEAKTAAVPSLQMVPADAAFYSAMLRTREQLEAVTHSRAWAKLMDLPLVKQGLQHAEEHYKSEHAAPFRKMLEDPENQELLALLGEATSEEIFCYGTSTWGDFVDLAGHLNSAINFGPFKLLAAGKGSPDEFPQLIGKSVLHALAENPDLLKVPDVVVGFKLRDPKKAHNQLKRLETRARKAAEHLPLLKDRIKRTKVGEGSFLTLGLDGSLFSWRLIPFKDFLETEEQYDKLIKTLNELKLTLSIGVSGDYLLVAMGSGPEVLASLAAGGDKLAGRPELKPLARFADKKLLSVGYVSKALRVRAAPSAKDMDGVVKTAADLLQNAPLDDKEKKKLLKDLAEIIGDVKKSLPQFGAVLSFAFLTETGCEDYSYDFTHFPGLKATKPLTLLDHLGGSPLLAAVFRQPESGMGYKTLARWTRTLFDNLEEIALARLPGDVKEKYQEYRKAILPLFKRFDDITTTTLLPALADGQQGLVFDARWTSKHWVKAAPETDKPLPMLEVALLLGLSDADLFRKAMAEYGRLIEDAVGVARELAPNANIPEVKLPAPKETKTETGTLYSWHLPKEAGLDHQVVPTAAVGEKVFALTLSHSFAERLLARKPLHVKGTALANRDRPLLAAVVFDWAGLIDAVAPWVELGVSQAAAAPGAPPQAKELPGHARTVLEVLKVYKGTTCAIYLEGGATVTHSVSIIRDLPE